MTYYFMNRRTRKIFLCKVSIPKEPEASLTLLDKLLKEKLRSSRRDE